MRFNLRTIACFKPATLILTAALFLLVTPVICVISECCFSAHSIHGGGYASSSSVSAHGESVVQNAEAPGYPAISQTFFSLNEKRTSVLYFFIMLAAAVISSLIAARFNKNIFVRKLRAVAEIEDAIGRAAEMGRPALYLTGLYDMNALPTMASIEILSYVAEKTAAYETKLMVPCCRSLVMNAARETVRGSFIRTGREALYDAENIRYITDDQWGFVSAVTGIMKREKPAACFYFGQFVSESLIYAETGHCIGAVQIAGTNEFSQIPFFVVACDFCLIGEELYAASAYFSKKNADAGSLRGMDICKILLVMIILAGVISETLYAIEPDKFHGLKNFKASLTSE